MTVLSVLSLFDTTKEQRLNFAEQVLENIENGTAEALKVSLFFKKMQDIINVLNEKDSKKNKNADLAKRFTNLLLDEASKHGKQFSYNNAEFEIKEMGVKYNYSKCNDPVLKELELTVSYWNDRLKERQDFLKKLPSEPFNFVDDNGEVHELYKPIKTSTTTLQTKLK